jgi:pimeloyl-ACP methyl ester carboxylesterase
MRALVAEGNPAEAVVVYERLRMLLREELGVVPSVALSALHVWVLEHASEEEPGDADVEGETRYARRPDGVSIAYQVLGEGAVDLVIVPGFMSHLDMQWADRLYRHWLRHLACGLRVIILDKAGTGASDAVEHVQSLEDWTGDVLAVLDAVGSVRPVLLGMSEGSAVATVFADLHPERVRGLVFYGALARVLPKEGYLWEHRDEIVAGLARFADVEMSWGCGGAIELWAPTMAGNDVQRKAWAVFERASGSPASIGRRLEALLTIDACDLLPDVRVPTLVLHRTGDRIVSVQHGRHLGAVIPGARYVELEGDDHVPYLGAGEALVAMVHEFIRALPVEDSQTLERSRMRAR